MPKTACFLIALGLTISPQFASISQAKPEVLATILEAKAAPTKKGKKSKPELVKTPEEYVLLDRAREGAEKKSSVASIDSLQRELLLSRFKFELKPLEKEIDETYFALELKKAPLLVKRRLWKEAYDSFQKGISGLGTFKWIYYWRTETSSALFELCNRNPKANDDLCLALARRVVDVFPKVALETALLRDLPLPEAVVPEDFGGDRLSQSYTEKTEKDEVAFQVLLDFYLKGKETDLVQGVHEFLETYPRSALRFRASFLLAEHLNKGQNKKEAAALYQGIIDQIPLSYYSIVSSERLGLDLKTRIKEEPIQVNLESQELSVSEKAALGRALDLLKLKKGEDLAIELEGFSRPRNYSSDFLLYLMKIASDGEQHLAAFRWANELIQRKSKSLTTRDMLNFLFPDPYLSEITKAATETDAKLDPILIQSLIKQESGFRASVISSSGALGLMQLMPFTAIDVSKDLKLYTLRDPAANILVGVKYFQSLVEKYDGNPVYALAAYNAGPQRVAKWKKEALPEWSLMDWIESIPFKETREYVTSILRNRYWYQVRKGVSPTRITELKGLTALPPADKK